MFEEGGESHSGKKIPCEIIVAYGFEPHQADLLGIKRGFQLSYAFHKLLLDLEKIPNHILNLKECLIALLLQVVFLGTPYGEPLLKTYNGG